MKTVITALSALLLGAAFATPAAAELAKEGSWNQGSFAYHGTSETLSISDNKLAISYKVGGVSMGANGTPFENTSFFCFGLLKAVDGKFKDGGYCKFVAPGEGNTFSWDYTADGVLGPGGAKGEAVFSGGTGIFKGITGSSTFTRTPLMSATETSFQGFGASAGSWKIP